MDKQRTRWHGLRRLAVFLGSARRRFYAGLGLGVADAACQSLVPQFFRYVINGLERDAATFMARNFWPTLVVGLLLATVFFTSAYFFHLWGSIGMAHFIRNLQVALYSHIQGLSQDFFQRSRVGEVTARLNGDLEVVSSAPIQGVVWVLPLAIFSLVGMLTINLPLAGMFLLLAVVLGWVMHRWLPEIRRRNREVRDATGWVNALMTEYIAVNPLIKTLAREEVASATIARHSDDVRLRKEKLYAKQFQITDTLQTLIKFLAPMILIFAGATMIARGRLSAGDLVAFWGYWIIMGGALGMILNTSTQLFSLLGAADRIAEFFAERPSVQEPATPRPLGVVRGEIRLEQVVFRYPGSPTAAPVLQGISLRVPAGQRLALVGPSGSGKSTLLQLLLRFYDPVEGIIRLDGIALPELAQSDLRSRIGMVMQESVFLSDSIRANLKLVRQEADDRQIWQALEQACAADFVADLPYELDTPLGERGVRLSGGQRQRLSLARVFLKDPPVVLLDEATSALDSATEALLQETLARLLANRTSITVAHRLATVYRAERIVVLDQGTVVAEGQHEDLVQDCPLYRKLCATQGLTG